MFGFETHRFIELDENYVFSHLKPEEVGSIYKKWKNTKKASIYEVPRTFKKIKYHKLEGKELYIQYTLEKLEKDYDLGISVYFIIKKNGKILAECRNFTLRLDYKNNSFALMNGDIYADEQNPRFLDCFHLDLDYIIDKIFKDTHGWRQFKQ